MLIAMGTGSIQIKMQFTFVDELLAALPTLLHIAPLALAWQRP